VEYKNPLGEDKIHKLLIRFSLPAIVGMTVNSLYNFVDRIFIGNSPDLGANGLAGITIAFPIMIMLLSIGVLFGVGGATRFSIKLGEGKGEEAEKTLANAFMMILISGTVFMVFGQIFLRPVLTVFGASETVLPYVTEYSRVILFGSVFQIGSLGLNHFIRADGNPKVAMHTMFIGAGLNIILDPLFIFGLKMGMRGAALATVIAQGVSFTWVVYYFLSRNSTNKFKKKYFKFDFVVIREIISLGIPDSSLQFANSFLNILLNRNLYAYGGDIAVSAMGIVHSLMMFLLLPIIGLRQGLQPIISFNFGARKYERVIHAVKLGVIAATLMATFAYIITRIFPQQLIALFNRDGDLLAFGEEAVKSWFLLMPVIGFQVVASSFFQAIGKYKSAMFLTLTRQIIFLIPAILIFPRIWGIPGLLHAAPFADSLAFILTGIWFYFGVKSLKNGYTDSKIHILDLSEQ